MINQLFMRMKYTIRDITFRGKKIFSGNIIHWWRYSVRLHKLFPDFQAWCRKISFRIDMYMLYLKGIVRRYSYIQKKYIIILASIVIITLIIALFPFTSNTNTLFHSSLTDSEYKNIISTLHASTIPVHAISGNKLICNSEHRIPAFAYLLEHNCYPAALRIDELTMHVNKNGTTTYCYDIQSTEEALATLLTCFSFIHEAAVNISIPENEVAVATAIEPSVTLIIDPATQDFCTDRSLITTTVRAVYALLNPLVKAENIDVIALKTIKQPVNVTRVIGVHEYEDITHVTANNELEFSEEHVLKKLPKPGCERLDLAVAAF